MNNLGIVNTVSKNSEFMPIHHQNEMINSSDNNLLDGLSMETDSNIYTQN